MQHCCKANMCPRHSVKLLNSCLDMQYYRPLVPKAGTGDLDQQAIAHGQRGLLQCSVLAVMFLKAVVSTVFRSLTSSSRVVLG